MSKKALLSIAPERNSYAIYHEEDGKHYVERRQDVSKLIEAAKVLADVPPDPSDGWRFMCVIPDTVLEEAMRDGWLEDKARWRKWMNDSDNRDFNGGRSHVS